MGSSSSRISRGSTWAVGERDSGLPGQADRGGPVTSQHRGGELTERGWDAAGQGGDGAEIQHAEPAAGQQQEVTRVQVGVHPAGAGSRREHGVREQPPGPVGGGPAVELAPARGQQVGAPVQQCGQARPLQPARDQHPGGRQVHGRDDDVGAAGRLGHAGRAGGGQRQRDARGERGRRLGLDAALAHVVQLLDHPAGQLVGQLGHFQPAEPGHAPGQEQALAQVRAQRGADPRVLRLHRHVDDLAVVVPPPSAVHLADRGGRGRGVVEGHQPLPPIRSAARGQVGGDDAAGDVGGHGRGRVGEPPQSRPVGPRPPRASPPRTRPSPARAWPRPLELAQGAEQLFGGTRGDLAASGPGQQAGGGRGARGMPQRQRGQPAGPPEPAGRQDRPLPARGWFGSPRPRLAVGHLDRLLSMYVPLY